MKLSLAPSQYFDLDGTPLASGRLRIFMHDSDTPAEVFTLEGETYTAATNPVILDDAGEVHSTIWWEAAIVDVKVDKRNADGGYMQIAQFQAGFQLPDSKNDTVVEGIAGLRTADPGLGTVLVIGYDSDGVAPPRHYIYDPDCTDAGDDGIIVDSDVTGADGKWDDEKLPCSVYGIAPGHEANISAFLGYPNVVGSFGIQTPKFPRFLEGTYTSNTTFSTTKALYFDKGAKFTNASFACRMAMIPDNADYIADFRFSELHATAHSSWFRTVNGFWCSNAATLIIDGDNHFTDTLVRYSITMMNTTIIGADSLPTTYGEGAYLQLLQNCTVLGRVFRPGQDYIRISSQAGDEMFTLSGDWDPGLISQGHHVQYDASPDLDLFANADRWVAVMVERKSRMGSVMPTTILDLQGRALSNGVSLNETNGFIGIRNATVNGWINAFGANCNLYNVLGTLNVNSNLGCTVVMENCNITFPMAPTGLIQLVSRDSNISVTGNPGIDTSETALNISGGTFQGFLGVSDPYEKSKAVVFNNVRLAGSTSWKLNRLWMMACNGDVKIDMIPYEEGGDYFYEINCQKNIFVGSSRIWFTGVFSQAHPMTQMAGHVMFGQCIIVGNSFFGDQAGGIKMLRTHPWAMAHFMADNPGNWVYEDNIGICPSRKLGFISNSTEFAGGRSTVGTDPKWIVGDSTYLVWVPYLNTDYLDDLPVPAQDGSGRPDSMCEVVDSIGQNGHPWNAQYGYCQGQAAATDYMDENQNNLFAVKVCLTVDLAVMPVPNGITRFP